MLTLLKRFSEMDQEIRPMPCSISAFQHFSISAFQQFSISAFQHFSISAFQQMEIT
jgi:hypothetical protein